MGAIFFCRVANFNALGIIEDSCLEVHAAWKCREKEVDFTKDVIYMYYRDLVK